MLTCRSLPSFDDVLADGYRNFGLAHNGSFWKEKGRKKLE